MQNPDFQSPPSKLLAHIGKETIDFPQKEKASNMLLRLIKAEHDD
jgi:hypothetical protein